MKELAVPLKNESKKSDLGISVSQGRFSLSKKFSKAGFFEYPLYAENDSIQPNNGGDCYNT